MTREDFPNPDAWMLPPEPVTLPPAPPTPTTPPTFGLPVLRSVDASTVEVQTLNIDDMADFPTVARALREMSDHLRTIVVPAIARANEPLRLGESGANTSVYGGSSVAHVPQLVDRSRQIGKEVKDAIEGVARSLVETSRVVERVGWEFDDVQRTSVDRLRNMNERFSTALRPIQRPTG